jgi:hypothetical protein
MTCSASYAPHSGEAQRCDTASVHLSLLPSFPVSALASESFLVPQLWIQLPGWMRKAHLHWTHALCQTSRVQGSNPTSDRWSSHLPSHVIYPFVNWRSGLPHCSSFVPFPPPLLPPSPTHSQGRSRVPQKAPEAQVPFLPGPAGVPSVPCLPH